MIQSLGLVRVPAAGTPVQATLNLPAKAADPANKIGRDYYPCHGVLIQALPTNAGRVYVGSQTMNKGAFSELYAILLAPSSASLPAFSSALTLVPNGIDASTFWIDADNNNDGVIVTVLVT